MTHTRPTKATRSSRSGRRWLRRIGWLALALLAVTCVVMVTFRLVEGRAKAKVAAVLGEVRVARTVGKESDAGRGRAPRPAFSTPAAGDAWKREEELRQAACWAITNGVWQGTLSDSELLALASGLPPEPAVTGLRLSLAERRSRLAQQLATPEGFEKLRPRFSMWPSVGSIMSWPRSAVSAALMTDSRLRASWSVVLADMDLVLAGIDERTNSWTPPPSETWPSMRLRESLVGLEWNYFSPVWGYGYSWSYEASAFERSRRADVEARLAAAMDIYRRQHGTDPDTLDALRAATPFALPTHTESGQEIQLRDDPCFGVRLVTADGGIVHAPAPLRK